MPPSTGFAAPCQKSLLLKVMLEGKSLIVEAGIYKKMGAIPLRFITLSTLLYTDSAARS